MYLNSSALPMYCLCLRSLLYITNLSLKDVYATTSYTYHHLCLPWDICSIDNMWCEVLILEEKVFSNSRVAIISTVVFNWWEVANTAVFYFYSVFIKALMDFVFWKCFSMKLRNILPIFFDICRIRQMIPYYFALIIVVIIIITFCWWLMCSSTSP